MKEKPADASRSSHSSTAEIQARFRRVFELYEIAVREKREELQRLHPEASEAEIEQRLRAWKLHRPGAEHGDAGGPPHFRIGKRRFDV